jgi:hypothetical protein
MQTNHLSQRTDRCLFFFFFLLLLLEPVGRNNHDRRAGLGYGISKMARNERARPLGGRNRESSRAPGPVTLEKGGPNLDRSIFQTYSRGFKER